MSSDGDLRRLLSPAATAAGVLAVLLRWRVELVLLGDWVAVW